MNLKIKILSQKYNPLLKRKEVVFEVNHSQEGQTSPRLEVRKNLANVLKAKIDLIFVEKVETKTGTMTAVGEANAYETPEQAKLVEYGHIIARNQLPEEPAKTGQTKKEASKETKPEREEKPKEGAKTREIDPRKNVEGETAPANGPQKQKEEKE